MTISWPQKKKNFFWKAHFFEICFISKYFRPRLLYVVNIGLHATLIRAHWYTSKTRLRGRHDNMVITLCLTPCEPPPLSLWKILAKPLRSQYCSRENDLFWVFHLPNVVIHKTKSTAHPIRPWTQPINKLLRRRGFASRAYVCGAREN